MPATASICRAWLLYGLSNESGFGEESHITSLKNRIELTALLFGGSTVPNTENNKDWLHAELDNYSNPLAK